MKDNEKTVLVVLLIAAIIAFSIFIADVYERESERAVAYKPVIYLYPEREEHVSVKLDPDAGFECTYPRYENGWEVTAFPNGTLEQGGKQYN